MKTRAAALLLLLVASASALAATPIPDGRWRFQFVDRKGRADRPLDVYTYRPRRCDSKCPIVFVLPGAKRDASNYIGYWELPADKHQVIVVVPIFTPKDWPGTAGYGLGDMQGQSDREKWAYSAIEHLFDEVRDGHNGYAIFGHLAGGQFVQRMALFRPDNRATVMAAASPGWYAMPEWRKEKAADSFPYSLVGSPAGEAELRQALAKRFILLAGERDDDPQDEYQQGASAKRQGESRVERAETFIKTATTAARDLGMPLRWELVELPENAQDGTSVARAAANAMFERK